MQLNRKSVLAVLASSCLVLLLSPLATRAQPTNEADQAPGQVYYDQARDAYRHGDYQQATWLLRQAIQVEPQGARYYVGLARAYFYLEDWDQAVYYYDLYLEHFPEHARQARRRADRQEAIRREREEANGQRATPTVPPTLPPDQQAALQAFTERLTTGPMITEDNTGAYFFYQTLLRTGYAHPRMEEIRQRLAEGILSEARACFEPDESSLIPVATLEQWSLVHERYRIVGELGKDISGDPEIQARIYAAQGQIDLINANYPQATERFQLAISLDPKLLLAHYGLLYALHMRATYEGYPLESSTLALFSSLEQLTRDQAPHYVQMVPFVRSILLADMGRFEDAAALIIELLAPGHVSGAPGTLVPAAPGATVLAPPETPTGLPSTPGGQVEQNPEAPKPPEDRTP